jgi:hypothetical protein
VLQAWYPANAVFRLCAIFQLKVHTQANAHVISFPVFRQAFKFFVGIVVSTFKFSPPSFVELILDPE